MNVQEFIFSNKPRQRRARHISFWIILCVGFYIQSIVPMQNKYMVALASLCFYFPSCIFSTYICLSYLLPSFLEKKKYRGFIIGFIALEIIFFAAIYVITMLQSNIFFGKPVSLTGFRDYFGLAFINTSHVITISILAMGIKFSKIWYLRQVENINLAKQKIINEVQLQKASIYPSFINHSLDDLYKKVIEGSTDAPATLLKLSDVLSFILYDSSDEWVPLKKELDAINNFLDIEKSCNPVNFCIHVEILGDASGCYIRPMALFSFLQGLTSIRKGEENRHLKFNIIVEIEKVNLQLILNTDMDSKKYYTNLQWESFVENIKKKMSLIYDDMCPIKFFKEDEQPIKIVLNTIIKRDIELSVTILGEVIKKEEYENS